ncbi:MAG TPA: hypothetical protein VFO79_05420, partial [Xanthomonadales bacterium]|nr:hypothetical protein [Xanthomonadales bacterium]
MRLHAFNGGLELAAHKLESTDRPIAACPVPARLVHRILDREQHARGAGDARDDPRAGEHAVGTLAQQAVVARDVRLALRAVDDQGVARMRELLRAREAGAAEPDDAACANAFEQRFARCGAGIQRRQAQRLAARPGLDHDAVAGHARRRGLWSDRDDAARRARVHRRAALARRRRDAFAGANRLADLHHGARGRA